MILHLVLIYLAVGLAIAIYTAKSVDPGNPNLTPGPVAMIVFAWPVFVILMVIVAVRIKLGKEDVEHSD